MAKFKLENGQGILQASGYIVPDTDSWFYAALATPYLCPRDVHEAIAACAGAPLTLKINSPGGEITAGAEIYTTLWEYGGVITFDIVGMAASEASVIAMAAAKKGNRCRISPLGLMMVHNVQTSVEGDHRAMEAARNRLLSANETIATAYARRTGKTTDEVQAMMDAETWYSPREALAAGLVDEIMLGEDLPQGVGEPGETEKQTLRAIYTNALDTAPPAHMLRRMAAVWGGIENNSAVPQAAQGLRAAFLVADEFVASGSVPAAPPPQNSTAAEFERAKAMLALEKIRFGGSCK